MGKGTPLSTPQSPFIITEFGCQTSNTFSQSIMRLPCILLFLTVAIRPVGVYAHGKPSGIVTTADQSEVQGHLRAQERANDQSDDERMSPVPEELISTGREYGIHILESFEVNSLIHEGTSDVTNMNLDSQREMQPTNTKRPRELLPSFLEQLNNAQEMEESAKPDIDIFLPKTNKYRLLEQANKHFFRERKDPKIVFDLYLLPYAKEKLLSKKEFKLWVQYFDWSKEEDALLLDTLLAHYSIKELEKAMEYALNKDPITNYIIVERVESELVKTFSHLTSPEEATLHFKPGEPKDYSKDNTDLLFYIRYVSNYYENKAQSKESKPIEVHPKATLVAFLKQLDNAQKMEESANPDIGIVLPKITQYRWLKKANKHFLKVQKDPKKVFNLYRLPYAEEKLFKKVQFTYWVQYLQSMEGKDARLLDTLLTYYSIETLEKAVKTFSQKNKEYANTVKLDLQSTFSDFTSPGDAYVKLGLDKIKENLFDSPNFLYWMRYVSKYNSKTENEFQKASTLFILFQHYGKEKFLQEFKRSDWTKDLEVVMKMAGIVPKNE